MSTETRNPLIRAMVILAVMTFGAGLLGHALHKLDLFITVSLILSFVLSSTLITWLCFSDDRKTRIRLVSITARLAPHGLNVQVCKGATYAVLSQGDLFEEIVTEQVDLDELEAWTSGLRHGVMLAEAGQDEARLAREAWPYADLDGTMEAHLARQEAQYSEDRAHRGIFGQYVEHIPGLED